MSAAVYAAVRAAAVYAAVNAAEVVVHYSESRICFCQDCMLFISLSWLHVEYAVVHDVSLLLCWQFCHNDSLRITLLWNYVQLRLAWSDVQEQFLAEWY